MARLDLEEMDFEELWLLHEELTKILSKKISAEKLELERRLAQLNPIESTALARGSQTRTDRPRRRYPKVLPKYSNPSAPEQTWSGRGKRPRWLVAALQSGHNLEEFRVPSSEAAKRVKPARTGHS
jgi:DNA-binding protein H-NS